MKTLRLFIIALFTMSTVAFAADTESLTQQAQESVRQMTQEMSALGIPEAKAQKMLRSMQQNRFQHQNIVRAQKTVMDAAKEGLPTEPIFNKAMEGMAKQAREQQVLKAMEAVRNRHQYAHRTAKSLSDDKNAIGKMAGTISDCLAAGIATGDMDAITAQLSIRTRQQIKNHADDLSLQTMETARTMARLGAKSTDIAGTIHQALQHQYTAQQMKQLRHNFSRDTRQTSAKQVAHEYAGSIAKSGNTGKSTGGSNNSGGSGNGADSGGGNSGGNDGGSNGSGGSGGGGGSGGSGSGGGSK